MSGQILVEKLPRDVSFMSTLKAFFSSQFTWWFNAEFFAVGFASFFGVWIRVMIQDHFHASPKHTDDDPFILRLDHAPWIVANFVGCFVMGVCMIYTKELSDISIPLFKYLTTGLCGCITTFSTWENSDINATFKQINSFQMIANWIFDFVLIWSWFNFSFAVTKSFKECIVYYFFPLPPAPPAPVLTDIQDEIDENEDVENRETHSGPKESTIDRPSLPPPPPRSIVPFQNTLPRESSYHSEVRLMGDDPLLAHTQAEAQPPPTAPDSSRDSQTVKSTQSKSVDSSQSQSGQEMVNILREHVPPPPATRTSQSMSYRPPSTRLDSFSSGSNSRLSGVPRSSYQNHPQASLHNLSSLIPIWRDDEPVTPVDMNYHRLRASMSLAPSPYRQSMAFNSRTSMSGYNGRARSSTTGAGGVGPNLLIGRLSQVDLATNKALPMSALPVSSTPPDCPPEEPTMSPFHAFFTGNWTWENFFEFLEIYQFHFWAFFFFIVAIPIWAVCLSGNPSHKVQAVALAPFGCWLRWSLARLPWLKAMWPEMNYPTLAANLIGVLIFVLLNTQCPNHIYYYALTTGFCGSLTTVSTFFAELHTLYFQKGPFMAIRYGLTTFVFSSIIIEIVRAASEKIHS